MKNTLSDLNNHLFMALERLNDEDADQEAVERNIEIARAAATIGKTIIDNSRLQLDAMKHMVEYGSVYSDGQRVPETFRISEKKK